MPHKTWILSLVLLLILVSGGIIWWKSQRPQPIPPPIQLISSHSVNSPSASSPAFQSVQPSPAVTSPSVVYPLSKFTSRSSLNPFGHYSDGKTTQPDAITSQICPVGKLYAGYHTAYDIEIFPTELNSAVAVYAVSTGTVLAVEPVTGYGGMIILSIKLNNQNYTAYYGHISLKDAQVKAGDLVKAGQQLSVLAPQCSAANGYARKHLHFGLHRGTVIDVRGYVTNQAALAAWVDPSALLSSLVKAQ